VKGAALACALALAVRRKDRLGPGAPDGTGARFEAPEPGGPIDAPEPDEATSAPGSA
jgi:hypothetical protein